MEWIVKIEKKPNQRIIVRFDPLNDQLVFIGQYKPHNKEWIDFSERNQRLFVENPSEHIINDIILIDAEKIQDILLHVYDEMKRRLDAYENIAEGFTLIKLIEIKEESTED